MKNTTKATAPKEATPASIYGLKGLAFPLEYSFLPGVTMKFFMRLQMNKESIESNQMFLGLPDAEREAKNHENNVHLLACLSTEPPEGVPDFEVQEGESTAAAIRRFFSEESEVKVKIVSDALTRYFRLTQPKEYL